jgi:MFS transporter, DHA1 family, tetracycline resistance protein
MRTRLSPVLPSIRSVRTTLDESAESEIFMSHDAQAAAPSHKPRVNRALLIILVTVFLDVMGFGIIPPVLPFYATAFGASGTEVGLLFTAFAAFQFLASPVFGALSDRFGRRPIILLGVGGQVVGYLLLGFSTSLSMLFLARIVAGAMAGSIGANQAYVADTTPPKERTRAFGLLGAAFGAGILGGPALGGVLILVHSSAPAFGAAGLLALDLLFVYMMLPESLPPERRTHKPIVGQLNPFSVLVPLARRAVLRGPLVATFLLNVALTGLQANFAVFAVERFGLGPTMVAGLLAAAGLANIVVQAVLVPRLSARLSDATLVLAGTAVNSIGYLATGFAPVPTVFWGSVPLTTGGYSLTRGPLTSLITKLVAPTEQGMVNGGVQATISLAGVVGPAWAGVVYASVGTAAPYWTAALMGGLAIVALALMRGGRRVQEEMRLPSNTVPSVEPTGADELSDVPTVSLAPTRVVSEVARLLPCGHEWRPNARFCAVCGAPVPS